MVISSKLSSLQTTTIIIIIIKTKIIIIIIIILNGRHLWIINCRDGWLLCVLSVVFTGRGVAGFAELIRLVAQRGLHISRIFFHICCVLGIVTSKCSSIYVCYIRRIGILLDQVERVFFVRKLLLRGTFLLFFVIFYYSRL